MRPAPDATISQRLTVDIRPCPYVHGHRVWRTRYRRLDTKLQDMPFVIWEALRRRYNVSNNTRPDLEFVPWPCLLHRRRSFPPRLGSFTVFSGAWAHNALELFDDTRALCASSAACKAGKVLRGVAVLSIESPSYQLSWPGAPHATASMNASRLAAFPGCGNASFQIPYPTSEHFDAARGMPEAPQLSSRRALAALVANAFKYRGSGAKEAIGHGPLRVQLHEECRRAPAGTCIGRGGPRGVGRGGSTLWNANNATFAAYQSAIFCLQPWGDTATRKGFWDALAVGAVNVVFAPRGDRVPYGMYADEFVGRHETFTITIPESVWSTGGTLAYLRKIPSSRILELQRGALRARARAMYTTAGDCRDANFAIASVLAERFRAHQAKKAG